MVYVRSIGVANTNALFVAVPNDSKQTEAIYSPDSLSLGVAQMPISLCISGDFRADDDRRHKPIGFTPCACARGNKSSESGSDRYRMSVF